MKATTALVSAAAFAASMAAAALPARAAVIADFDPITNSADYKWVADGSGGSLFSINSSGDSSAQGVSTQFTFLSNGFPDLRNLASTFTLSATAASGNPASMGASGTFTQPGLDGTFSFTYSGPATTIDGVHLTTGENLLSGTFDNAWIQGAGGSGSTNVTIGNGGSASYTSAVLDLSHITPNSQEFAFNMLSVSPTFHATTGDALGSFTANGGGNFDAAGAVPEPATWGLMILGFGGAGALLRSRRREFVKA